MISYSASPETESKLTLCAREVKTNGVNSHTSVSKNTEKLRKKPFDVLLILLSEFEEVN